MLRKPTEANTIEPSMLQLRFHLLSCTGRNSNEKMTYSWAVDLDVHGQGKWEWEYNCTVTVGCQR